MLENIIFKNMKIKRFNSINENSSVLGDKWTKEKFDKIRSLKTEIENEEDDLKPLIKEFLLLNPNLQEQIMELNEEELEILSFQYTPNKTIVFSIWYRPESDDFDDFEANLNQKKFDEFLDFLKEPDVYINTRKYNL